MRYFIIVLLPLLLIGCKSTVYVPVESVRTEYIHSHTRDSIQLYDSIYVKEKGDSVTIEKYKYIYIDRLRADTIQQTDSIRVPYPVIEIKEVNKLKQWQKGFIIIGFLFVVYVVYRFYVFLKS